MITSFPEPRFRKLELMDNAKNCIESGAWIGRQQAFRRHCRQMLRRASPRAEGNQSLVRL
jgi:hypothetical protein